MQADGSPVFLGSKGAGASITIKAEMPIILLIANTAHPLDGRPEFNSTPHEVAAKPGKATTSTDELWSKTPEGRRAFINTQDYLAARGIA